MRLERLTVKGIGPFLNAQTVDFTALTRSGLFLIDGPTGAGKSTLIDAITFALYGEGEGATKERMRSDLCSPDDVSEVRLSFRLGETRYEVRRTPSYLKPGRASRVNASATLRIFDAAEVEIACHTSVKDVSMELRRALGLERDQFRQLVVLPQGEFAALLRMGASERKSTLSSLIGQPLFSRIQADLKERGAAAEAACSAANTEVSNCVQQLRGLLADDAPDPEGDQTSTAFEAVLATLQGRVSELAPQAADAESRWQAAVDQANLAAAAAEQVAAAGRARAQVDSRRQVLTEQERALSDDQLEGLRATLQERIGAWAAHVEWEATADARSRQRSELAARGSVLEARSAELKQRADDLPGLIAAHDQRLIALAEVIAGRALHEGHAADARATVAALTELAEQLQAQSGALAAQAAAEGAVRDADDGVHEAEQIVADLVRQQREQSAARLAGTLVDGQSCPVCGAVEHPHPAAAPEADLVSDEEIAAAEVSRERARAARAAADRHRVECTQAAAAAAARVAGVQARVGAATPESAAQSLAAATQGLAECDAAEAERTRLAAERSAQTAELQGMAEQVAAVSGDLAAVRQQLATLEAREEEEAVWRRANVGNDEPLAPRLEAMRSSVAAIGDYLEALHAVDVAVAAVPEALRDRSAAELAEWAQRATQHARELEEAHRAVSDRLNILRYRLTGGRAALDRLSEAEAVRQEVIADSKEIIHLAGLATGRGSANRRSTPLEDYAMQRRFESVLEEASVHLSRMSGGRYTLELDVSARGNANAGLGIEVRDGLAGTVRPPSSLSGGETFYTSLALALGLADVVMAEAGVMPLDTLFVDEGFGSLDQDTLQIVMEQLGRLQDSGRFVGLISHVEEMKQWIPERIEVTPLGTGESVIAQRVV